MFNDRLLLGLKGTMSEAALHALRARRSAPQCGHSNIMDGIGASDLRSSPPPCPTAYVKPLAGRPGIGKLSTVIP